MGYAKKETVCSLRNVLFVFKNNYQAGGYSFFLNFVLNPGYSNIYISSRKPNEYHYYISP